MSRKNLSYSLIEKKNDSVVPITYQDLLKQVDEDAEKATHLDNEDTNFNMDEYIALEIDYNENYKKKELERIADYYEISKRKKRKQKLIEDIVIFEKDESNKEITERRKLLWYYMEEINNDNYLSKFLILD
ncbi:MAG: hypothetical protein CL678_05735 [Bdellovibrionaceae bacterium]|nr:hypothetical protein [Pseudobdellovibrionaceae bacterium]|tara:strand:+ start:280 stop:672 length:393 start_codon:yes stop_codon:yes gene_type:complete